MRLASLLRPLLAFALTILLAGPASAQLTTGGHDETSEPMGAAFVLALPSPGTCGPGVAPHLLISEVVVTPTGAEYVEICNGTGAAVDLSNYYVSDDWFVGPPANGYFKLPQAGYVTAVNTDFIVRFPAGTVIPAGAVWTVAVDGAAFMLAYGAPATFEILNTDGTPDMVLVSGNSPLSTALLTNTSEVVVLFHWDGASDIVCDVDICQWGVLASGNAIEKTGQAVDGPDADILATAYLPDTPRALQTYGAAPAGGGSLIRQNCVEQPEAAPGNGCISSATPTHSTTWGTLKVLYR